MPRRKPKSKPVEPEAKRKRGRPPKAKGDPPVLTPVFEIKTPKEPVQAPVTPDPAKQKEIDASTSEFKKRLEIASKDATPDDILKKLFDVLGEPTVDW